MITAKVFDNTMTPKSARLMALLCLVLALAPFLLMPTSVLFCIVSIRADVHDLVAYPDGTSSFQQDRKHDLAISLTALMLDAMACVALWGVAAIALNLLKPRWQSVVWATCAIAGLGSALMRNGYVGPETAQSFSILFVYVPAVVGLLSISGFLIPNKSEYYSGHALPR